MIKKITLNNQQKEIITSKAFRIQVLKIFLDFLDLALISSKQFFLYKDFSLGHLLERLQQK